MSEIISVSVIHPEDNSLMKFSKGKRNVESITHHKEVVEVEKTEETVAYPIYRVQKVVYNE